MPVTRRTSAREDTQSSGSSALYKQVHAILTQEGAEPAQPDRQVAEHSHQPESEQQQVGQHQERDGSEMIVDFATCHRTVSQVTWACIAICMTLTWTRNYDTSISNKCGPRSSWIPSLSSTLIDYPPQRHIWYILLLILSMLRVFEVLLVRSEGLLLVRLLSTQSPATKTTPVLVATFTTTYRRTALGLVLEHVGLVLLSFITTADFKPAHSFAFVIYMVGASITNHYSRTVMLWRRRQCLPPSHHREDHKSDYSDHSDTSGSIHSPIDTNPRDPRAFIPSLSTDCNNSNHVSTSWFSWVTWANSSFLVLLCIVYSLHSKYCVAHMYSIFALLQHMLVFTNMALRFWFFQAVSRGREVVVAFSKKGAWAR